MNELEILLPKLITAIQNAQMELAEYNNPDNTYITAEFCLDKIMGILDDKKLVFQMKAALSEYKPN
jgi:hypothetical protein